MRGKGSRRPSEPRLRIVSGGQSGVDRAALDVALELGVPCGGWCPAGRAAEDGPIPSRYPLRETPSAEPAQRTEWNVRDSDATLVLCRGEPAGGTSLAVECARRAGRPFLLVDPATDLPSAVAAWIEDGGFAELNVAGPRESEAPGTYAGARTFLTEALRRLPVDACAERTRPLGGPGTGAPHDLPGAAPTRVLVTGGAGLLGQALLRSAPGPLEAHATWRTTPVTGAAAHRVELSDAAAVRDVALRVRPHVVIHTAYSAASGERDILAATRGVIGACHAAGAALVHLSTDALLDGEAAPYTEDADPAPVHEYGRWKAAAETEVRRSLPGAAVIRTSLVVATDPLDPRSAWVADSLRDGKGVTLFTDEIRAPIEVGDLAAQIWEVLSLPTADRAGVWHLCGPEALSRYAIGLLIAARERLDPSGITPAPSRGITPPRPRDLRLLTTRADRALRTRARGISEVLAPR